MNFNERISAILGQIQRPGSYCASGTIELHPPRLEVEGVGPIALPLLPAQARQLIAAAEHAPYGQGTETRLDTRVRNTWQIDADRLRIGGKYWPATLERIVALAAEGLGVEQPVVAESYKLLIYETGGLFVGHRDTEKAPGMFATLVVALPSEYCGGVLQIRHQGEQVEFDLRCEDPGEARFAAFYADCVHEVLPVTSGYRLNLIYNLIRPCEFAGPPPTAPDFSRQRLELTQLLSDWGSAPPDDDSPAKLVYLFEHAYTEAELGFASLKGRDAALASVALDAARTADCEIFVALLNIEESGTAAYLGTYYGHRGYYQDENDEGFEVDEVCDRSAILSQWRRPDGSLLAMPDIPFDDDEVMPPRVLDDLEPDDLEFSEATGNAGASFDRLYSRAVLVLWPRSQRMRVMVQGGIGVAITLLGELVAQWRQQGSPATSPLRAEALQLAVTARRIWPAEGWGQRETSKDGAVTALLDHLLALDELEEVEAFIEGQVVTGSYSRVDNPSLVRALMRLPGLRALQLLLKLIEHHGPTLPLDCADLLTQLTAVEDLAPHLQPLGQALLQSTCREPSAVPYSDYRMQPPPVTPELVTVLLGALARIDANLARQALTWLLGHPDRYPMDTLLLPATLSLVNQPEIRDRPSLIDLRGAVRQHLQQRIAEPLAAPADFRRPSHLGCQCAACGELSRFLADPTQSIWRYKAAEGPRRHVEDRIGSSQADVDCTTDKHGRPYTLVCRKNQNSYLRRVRQREQDIKDLNILD